MSSRLLLIGSVESKDNSGENIKFNVIQNQDSGEYLLEDTSPGGATYLLDDDTDDGHFTLCGVEDMEKFLGNSEYADSLFEKLEDIIEKSRGLTPYDVEMGEGIKVKKHPFEYQKPTDEQVAQITAVREAMKAVYDNLMSLPESRERSIAITKLEEASMWANKGIVFN